MSKPVVAIVGRPNVGKSTLFNALAGEMISIVKDTPGVTRDRIYADVTWLDKEFTMIDTGGIEPDSKDIILSQMREQAQIAIDTADVIIFITDVKQGLVDADSKVADMLRRSGKPVVLVVNKVDNFDKYMADVYEFYNLGIGDPVPISAASRLGCIQMAEMPACTSWKGTSCGPIFLSGSKMTGWWDTIISHCFAAASATTSGVMSSAVSTRCICPPQSTSRPGLSQCSASSSGAMACIASYT